MQTNQLLGILNLGHRDYLRFGIWCLERHKFLLTNNILKIISIPNQMTGPREPGNLILTGVRK